MYSSTPPASATEQITSNIATQEPPLCTCSLLPICTSVACSKLKDGGIVSLELRRSLLIRSLGECYQSKRKWFNIDEVCTAKHIPINTPP